MHVYMMIEYVNARATIYSRAMRVRILVHILSDQWVFSEMSLWDLLGAFRKGICARTEPRKTGLLVYEQRNKAFLRRARL